MNPERRYRKSLTILEDRYGDKHHYVSEMVRALLKGPVVRAEDDGCLRKVVIEPGSCITNLEGMEKIQEIDTIYALEIMTSTDRHYFQVV